MPKLGEDVYLGDGVYARLDSGGSVELYTSNGIRNTNVIYLESETLDKLKEYLNSPITI